VHNNILLVIIIIGAHVLLTIPLWRRGGGVNVCAQMKGVVLLL
jgi:hypothetical protein